MIHAHAPSRQKEKAGEFPSMLVRSLSLSAVCAVPGWLLYAMQYYDT